MDRISHLRDSGEGREVKGTLCSFHRVVLLKVFIDGMTLSQVSPSRSITTTVAPSPDIGTLLMITPIFPLLFGKERHIRAKLYFPFSSCSRIHRTCRLADIVKSSCNVYLGSVDIFLRFEEGIDLGDRSSFVGSAWAAK